MKVVYKPGSEQTTADMLSRAATGEAVGGVPDEQIFTVNQLRTFMSDLSHKAMKKDLPVSKKTYLQIQKETRMDPELAEVHRMIPAGWPLKLGDAPMSARPYFSYR